MIISKTPFRVSFLGGGSDLPWFYEEHEGAVISCAIKKYMYISIHPLFGAKNYRLKYSKLEDVSSIDDISHPIIKACLKRVDLPNGMEIASIADIPAGTGLGSSSSFTVGLLNALYACQGVTMPKWEIAEEACDIEINEIGSPIGKQDQYAASLGGINILRFRANGSVDVEPLRVSLNTISAIGKKLRLYYLGGTRDANQLLKEQSSIVNRQRKVGLIKNMVSMIDQLKLSLENGDVNAIGPALHEAWVKKKELSSGVSSPAIDEVYDFAMKNGAEGGKLLGAGGNGFLLLSHTNHDDLSKKLSLSSIPFEIDLNGTTINSLD